MSQMPEAAGSWPEEGSQYGAPMDPVQQAYPQQAQYQQQAYPQQQPYGGAPGYPAPQQPGGYPQPQEVYPGQTVAQPPVYAEDERSSVPSEFDHLFRDSVPTDRRSISRQAVVGAAPPPAGFAQAAPPQPQQAAPTAMYAPAEQGMEQPPFGGYPQQQPPFGGPGGDGYEPLPERPGRSRAPLVIGGVVVVVAAVGLYLGLSGGNSNKPQARPTVSATGTVTHQTPQQEADALYQLVSQAKTLRSEINGGVSELMACKISDAQTDIGNSVTGRQQALAQLQKLDVSKIDGGADVVAALKTAWTDSYTSDSDYGKAADDFANGAPCNKSALQKDANLKAANSGSGDSTRAKADAAKLWNDTMTKYNEPEISGSQL